MSALQAHDKPALAGSDGVGPAQSDLQFQGSSSPMRLLGCSGMRPSTSPSYARGSRRVISAVSSARDAGGRHTRGAGQMSVSRRSPSTATWRTLRPASPRKRRIAVRGHQRIPALAFARAHRRAYRDLAQPLGNRVEHRVRTVPIACIPVYRPRGEMFTRVNSSYQSMISQETKTAPDIVDEFRWPQPELCAQSGT